MQFFPQVTESEIQCLDYISTYKYKAFHTQKVERKIQSNHKKNSKS
jgi:hypothetical protein